MGSPRFVSPGAMAGSAIEDFLMKRALMEREQMEMEFRQRQAAESAQRQAQQLQLQQQQEARIAQGQQQQMADLEKQRSFTRAGTIAENALPGDPVDEQTAALLREAGFGGQIQQSESADPLLGTVTPGVLQMRGGSKYLNAQAQREATAANAEATRQAQAERAAADRDMRGVIAGMANQGRAETTALRNDLLQTQVEAAKQKATDKEEAKVKARNAARVRSQTTVDVLKELADFDPVTGKATLKPGTANLFGMQNPLARLNPGGDTNNAAAALKRLTGTAVIDLINEMKNQSATGATGFGSLSGSEGKLLETSASELNSPLISDERAAAELERMYRTARQLYGEEPANTGAPAGATPQRVYYDANGKPVQR